MVVSDHRVIDSARERDRHESEMAWLPGLPDLNVSSFRVVD